MTIIHKPIVSAVLVALIAFADTAQANTSNSVDASSNDTQQRSITIGEVEKTAPPERGTGSLSKELVKHASPNENFQSVLRNVPGFTVTSTGPSNLTTSDSTFYYQGFNSDQVGVQFNGVPLINTFRGGTAIVIGKTIVLRSAPFQNFIHVMDACQKAGVSVIGIAAKASPWHREGSINQVIPL